MVRAVYNPQAGQRHPGRRGQLRGPHQRRQRGRPVGEGPPTHVNDRAALLLLRAALRPRPSNGEHLVVLHRRARPAVHTLALTARRSAVVEAAAALGVEVAAQALVRLLAARGHVHERPPASAASSSAAVAATAAAAAAASAAAASAASISAPSAAVAAALNPSLPLPPPLPPPALPGRENRAPPPLRSVGRGQPPLGPKDGAGAAAAPSPLPPPRVRSVFAEFAYIPA
mmetsp:Transcript_35419/g.111176  ORF Transcript_35419/g.111176 Transcript_35419/m.111176 type:complete len:229 (-) Transcript_35419:1605-2291(-)